MSKISAPSPERVYPVPVASASAVGLGWLGSLFPELVSDDAVVARRAETLRAEYRAAGLDPNGIPL